MKLFQLDQFGVEIGGTCLLFLDHLEIDQNCLTAIIGPNGAGKTTLLRALAGLPQLHGDISCLGRVMTTISRQELSRTLLWVPQSLPISFDIPTRDLVCYGRYPWHRGRVTSADWLQVDQALEQMGIAHLGRRSILSLSSGEFKKVQIARGLAASSYKIMLLDEPCANLDLGAAEQLMQLLKDLAKKGLSIVMASHDLQQTQKFSDDVVALKKGQLQFHHQPSAITDQMIGDLFDRPQWTRSLMT